MSGHSKWHNIRLKKGKMDAERGKIFTKLAREIIMAAQGRRGQPGLATCGCGWRSRRRARTPCRRTTSSAPSSAAPANSKASNYEELTYEGYGPGGVAVMVEALTDNRNRTVAEIRNIFSQERRQPGRVRLRGLDVRPARA